MPAEVEFTDEFELWWEQLTNEEQESVDFSIRLLEQFGIHLARPHADTIRGSKFPNMRELRCQHHGRPLRVLFAFDPRRMAILLIGGDKTGDSSWYQRFVPLADRIYEQHLKELSEEDENGKKFQ